MQTMTFDKFAEGQVVTFQRTYTQDDIDSFAQASGDFNSLHIDVDYAAATPSKKTVVPMQQLIMPFSMIAGMLFPGKPSLFLGQEVRALRPAFCNDKVTYSAKILSINKAQRVLTIRVLVIRESEVLLSAILRTQAREQNWEQDDTLPIRSTSAPGRALITGGSGELGTAIAKELAKKGWDLLLQDRGNQERRALILDRLSPFGRDVKFIEADLSHHDGQTECIDALLKADDISLVLHTASAGLHAGLEDLVQTNYVTLRRIGDAIAPSLLARQNGTLIFISSLAVAQTVHGLEDYAAAKAMGMNYINMFEQLYSEYDVHGHIFMPGMIRTKFSRELGSDSMGLLPAQAAEAVVDFTLSKPDENCLWMDGSEFFPGRYSFSPRGYSGLITHNGKNPQSKNEPQVSSNIPLPLSTESTTARLLSIVRAILRYDGDMPRDTAGVGTFPGWDSLRHIEIILAIEIEFAIRFTAQEMQDTTNFRALAKLIGQKIEDNVI